MFGVSIAIGKANASDSSTSDKASGPTGSELEVSFIVIGDWGRRGNYNQSECAASMAKVAAKMEGVKVISTGDNFYNNGKGKKVLALPYFC